MYWYSYIHYNKVALEVRARKDFRHIFQQETYIVKKPAREAKNILYILGSPVSS